MTVRSLHRDAQHPGDLPGGAAPRQQREHLLLPAGQTVRAVEPRHRLSRRLDHRGHGVRVQTPRPRLVRERLRRLLGRQGRAVRTRLALGVEHVRRCQQAGGAGQLGGGDAAVVAGPVQALVVSAGDRLEVRPERAVGQHPLGPVGVQAHVLPLVGGQRTRPAPGGRAHRHPAQVVHQPGTPDPATPAASVPQTSAADAASSATPAECPVW